MPRHKENGAASIQLQTIPPAIPLPSLATTLDLPSHRHNVSTRISRVLHWKRDSPRQLNAASARLARDRSRRRAMARRVIASSRFLSSRKKHEERFPCLPFLPRVDSRARSHGDRLMADPSSQRIGVNLSAIIIIIYIY